MSKLLKMKGALPFLAAVFLNSFVDLGHKIIIQNTIFKVYDDRQQVILTAIVNGLILLPVLLLFGVVGAVSDRFPKNQVMRKTAWLAVLLTLCITLCYAQGWFWPAFAMTFLLAVQSAFYFPAKYGYIKGFFGTQHLAEANGLVQAVSIIAILAGILLFSVLFEYWFPLGVTDKGDIIRSLVPIGIILVANALLEVYMVYRLPQVDQGHIEESFNFKRGFSGDLIRNTLRPVFSREAVWLSMLGLAMFWSIGQVMLAAFPAFAKEQLNETNTIVIQAIIAASGLGIALGSAMATRFSRNYIETGLIPLGAAGIALGLGALPHLNSVAWLGLDFLFIGMMGGIFIVPLNALVQFYASESQLGKMLAASNLIQNIGMMSFLILTVIFALMGISSKQLLIIIAFVSIIGGIYTVLKLPQSMVRFLLSYLLTNRYRIRVENMQSIPEKGGVLLLGNHISWIDWALVQIACPRPVKFVMLKSIYNLWYLKWFFKLFGCIPIEPGPSSKRALAEVTEALNRGRVVCLFPEGAISRSGHLGEFRRGYEQAARTADDSVVIQPFYLHGLWGSQFSRASARFKQNQASNVKRELMIVFGNPMAKETTADVLKRAIFDLSIESWNRSAKTLPTLAHACVDGLKQKGNQLALLDNLTKQRYTGRQLLAAAIGVAQRLKQLSGEQKIGVMLPSSADAAIVHIAMFLAGKTLVNLDPGLKNEDVAKILAETGIRSIYTSKQYSESLAQTEMALDGWPSSANIIYMEDLRNSRINQTLRQLVISCLNVTLLKRFYCTRSTPDQTATIIYSQDSEGWLKGVRLSHRNLLANIKQITQVLNPQREDVAIGVLPLYNVYGLTVTQLMPLTEGLTLVCSANAADSLDIAKAIKRNHVSILFATPSLLQCYCENNKIHLLMLESLRLVLSGGEKLSSQVRNCFKEKFNKDILEGYGATELTAVASVNLPDYLDPDYLTVQLGQKRGTVGMPLPGTGCKIVDPDTLQEMPAGQAGMVLIGGPQIMQGYQKNPIKTAERIIEKAGQRWFITRDRGYLDKDGFLCITRLQLASATGGLIPKNT